MTEKRLTISVPESLLKGLKAKREKEGFTSWQGLILQMIRESLKKDGYLV